MASPISDPSRLPPEALEAGLHEADDQELDDDLAVINGETGIEAEREIAQAEAERDAQVDLLEGLREMQGAEGIRWRLYRVNADDPHMNGFIDELSTGQLTQKYIRDKCGGGTYRVRGYNVATGKFKCVRTIRIAGDAPKKDNEVSQQSANFNFSEYIAQQDARDQARRTEERRLQDEREDRFWKRITALGTIAAPIVAAMVGRKDDTASLIAALRPKETDPLEMFRLLREMKELDRPQQSQTNLLEQAMGMLERFKDLGAFGGASGEVSWLDIGREAIKALGPSVGQGIQSIMESAATAKAIEAQRAGQPAPALAGGTVAAPASVPRLLPPQGSPASMQPPGVPGSLPAGSALRAGSPAGTAASPSISPTITGDEEMLKLLPLLPWLKGETERLLIAAARGSDPELRAAAMFDDLPDNADIEAVGQVLSRADWFSLFSAIDSRVAQYEPWFAEVRKTLLQLIQEETGVAFGVRSDGGIDPEGRPIVNVQGPGAGAPSTHHQMQGQGVTDVEGHLASRAPAPVRRIDPDVPIERPSGPPSLTGV